MQGVGGVDVPRMGQGEGGQAPHQEGHQEPAQGGRQEARISPGLSPGRPQGPRAAVDAHAPADQTRGQRSDLRREAGDDVRFARPGVPVGVEHGELGPFPARWPDSSSPPPTRPAVRLAGSREGLKRKRSGGIPGGRRPPPHPSRPPPGGSRSPGPGRARPRGARRPRPPPAGAPTRRNARRARRLLPRGSTRAQPMGSWKPLTRAPAERPISSPRGSRTTRAAVAAPSRRRGARVS